MKQALGTMEYFRVAVVNFAVALVAILLLCSMPADAQTANASVSGVIVDTGGARIPGAKISLVNEASKSARTTVTSGDGVFNISGVSPGSYVLTVTAKTFEKFVEKDIALHPGDSASLPVIQMKIGAENVTITVTAHDMSPGNGEISSLITAEDIKHLATEGRDVTELVKILPGFALQPGAVSGTGQGLSNSIPDTTTVSPGGSLGNYAASGSPANGIGLISDGADVQDPGAAGATTQNINMDMVQEVKVSTSNFGADVAKGPVVINAVGKSGGQAYHGSVYVLGRTTFLNSNDWMLNLQGIPRPPDRYIYPGFGFGGPVRIPGTKLNKANKLLFQVNAEDYIQRNSFSGGSASAALRFSTVLTDRMRGGDFSQSALGEMYNMNPTDLLNQCTTTGTMSPFTNYCNQPGGVTPQGHTINNGVFPVADIDPGAAVYVNHLYPRPNRVAQPVLGTNQPSDGSNRIDTYLTNTELYQIRGRVDYNLSDSSKFYIVYNTEQGKNYAPFTMYYNANNSAGMFRDPSLIVGGTNSQTTSINYVKTFSPTLTNEAFGAISYYRNTYYAQNESAQTQAALGWSYQNMIPNGTKQIPQLLYSSGLPMYQGPDFSFGDFYSRKLSTDFGDNLTKTWRQHTFKVGFYYERTANNQQSPSGATQGAMSEYGLYNSWYSPNWQGGAVTTTPNSAPQNTITNFLFGELNSYTQQNFNPIIAMYFKTIDGYVTDNWKVTKQLTLDIGVRFDHLGPWENATGIGGAYWVPSTYATPAYTANVGLNALPGIRWHGNDSSLPNSVALGRWAFVSPRVGFAYDVYGNGKTTFNGGAGFYRSHDSNSYAGTVATTLGSTSIGYANGFPPTLFCIDAYSKGTAANNLACTKGAPPTYVNNAPGGSNPPPVLTPANQFSASQGPSFSAADLNDSQQPLTMTFSLGISQQLNHIGNLVINYSGNTSNHLLTSQNINTIPMGGMFKPDPNINSPFYGETRLPDSADQINDYRPYPFYNQINVLRHGLISNYNSLQMTVSKWVGPLHYNLNYTWSKAMSQSTNPADQTNLRNDYGIAPYDRTHVFNASYTYIMGSPFHVNRYLGGVVNGWEISGITNIQSGPNLQAAYSNNFGLSTVCPGNASGNSCPQPTDNKSYLGTPDISLQPIMTCDPSTNLKHNQFINPSCLTLGPIGVNGPFHYPYLRGPHYFNSDLSVQKNFKVGEKKSLEFRFSAFNFMNHPLTSLVAATVSPLHLYVSSPGGPANDSFGSSAYKENRRVSEVGLHYNF